MKVRIIRPTIAQKRQVMPGEELDVSKQEGVQLVSAGKAIPVAEIEMESTSLATEPIETRAEAEPPAEDEPTAEDPKPKRKKVKKVS